MNAKEARNISEENKFCVDDAISSIRDSARQGLFIKAFLNPLHPDLASELERMGYDVDNDTRHGCCTVRW